jgi:hypothetical protein
MRISEFPFVFLSYDEPWADDFFHRLTAIVPGARRVHGVQGLDACHKAAARVAASRWLVTVDADTDVDSAFLSVDVPDDLLNDSCRLDWVSRNVVNGLTYGNGGLKVWPSRLVEDLRSHEAAPPEVASVDHDHGLSGSRPNLIRMPGCYSVVRPAETAFHAFRSGFREGARLGRVDKRLVQSSGFVTAAGSWRARHLRVLCTIGAHAPNGLWLIYGARLGLWMANATDWDIRKINDYAWFDALWADMIVPRFSPGASVCRTSKFTWDADRLRTEITALGQQLARLLGLELPDLPPELSRWMVGQTAPQMSPAHLDTLGYMFLRGLGVARDTDRALDLFETGRLANLSGAINNLARVHEQGLGVPTDPDRARALYEYSISLGNRHAPYHLAQFLKVQDDRDATKSGRVQSLLRLAAERGFAPQDATAE